MTDKPNVAQERWKPIPEYDEYEISNLGNVRTKKPINRNCKGGEYRQIKTTATSKLYPYRVFSAYKNGKSHRLYVHRAILMAFDRMPEKGEWSCHIDGDASNNTLENLRWGTNSDNQKDSVRHGTHHMSKRLGEDVNGSILKASDIPKIRKMLKTHKQKDIAKMFGVTPNTISALACGRSWRHI